MNETCRVLATLSELDEDGEVISVGESISRWAVPYRRVYLHDASVDEVPFIFDKYAEGGVDGAVVVEGIVTALDALYVKVTWVDGNGWEPCAGSVTRAPLETTADTRRPVEHVVWGPTSEPDDDGVAYAIGYPDTREGDQMLAGWVFTLERWAVRSGDTEHGRP